MSPHNHLGSAKRRADYLKQELGLDIYARFPLRVIERLMDRPPSDPTKRKCWRAIEQAETRVYHTIIRFSWCFPICWQFAVMTRDGEICFSADDEPVPLTGEAIAAMLGMRQPHVSDAIARLIEKKLLRREGRRLYPVPKPADLAPEEREKYTCTGILFHPDEPALPADFIRLINDLRVDDATRAELYQRAVLARETYNREHAEARARQAAAFRTLKAEIQSLLVSNAAQTDEETAAPEAEETAAPETVQPGVEICTEACTASDEGVYTNPILIDTDTESEKDLVSDSAQASSSSSSLNKSSAAVQTTTTIPSAEEQNAADQILEAFERYGTPDRPAALALWRSVHTRDPQATPAEVVALVHEKAPLKRERGFGFFLASIPPVFPLPKKRQPSGGAPPPELVDYSWLDRPEDPQDPWARVKAEIKKRIETAPFSNWFLHTRFASLTDGRLLVRVPNVATKGWIEFEYLPLIRDVLQALHLRVGEIEFILAQAAGGTP